MTYRIALALLLFAATAQAERIIQPTNDTELAQALRNLKAGDTIQLGEGPYKANFFLKDIQGNVGNPIRIIGPAEKRRAKLISTSSAFHLAKANFVTFENLHITGAASNAINVDDGGDTQNFPNVSTNITFRNLLIENTGPKGTANAIKLAGVAHFEIDHCTFQNWGEDGGCAIDCVGVAEGLVRNCTFLPGRGSVAVQFKGGSYNILIENNFFNDAGSRAINAGGSTGEKFFRPNPAAPPRFEAKNITIERNLFVGSDAPLCFVGIDGGTARFNTIYHPRKWAIRILQETVRDDFVPSRNVTIENNLIVFRSTQWFEGGLNIGPNTAPKTFTFTRNAWFCTDKPTQSKPTLPTPEKEGTYGTDPLFVDPAKNDFSLRKDSPLQKVGHTAR